MREDRREGKTISDEEEKGWREDNRKLRVQRKKGK